MAQRYTPKALRVLLVSYWTSTPKPIGRAGAASVETLRGSSISSMQLGNDFLQLAYFAKRRMLENEFFAALAGEGLGEVEMKQDQ